MFELFNTRIEIASSRSFASFPSIVVVYQDRKSIRVPCSVSTTGKDSPENTKTSLVFLNRLGGVYSSASASTSREKFTRILYRKRSILSSISLSFLFQRFRSIFPCGISHVPSSRTITISHSLPMIGLIDFMVPSQKPESALR